MSARPLTHAPRRRAAPPRPPAFAWLPACELPCRGATAAHALAPRAFALHCCPATAADAQAPLRISVFFPLSSAGQRWREAAAAGANQARRRPACLLLSWRLVWWAQRWPARPQQMPQRVHTRSGHARRCVLQYDARARPLDAGCLCNTNWPAFLFSPHQHPAHPTPPASAMGRVCCRPILCRPSPPPRDSPTSTVGPRRAGERGVAPRARPRRWPGQCRLGAPFVTCCALRVLRLAPPCITAQGTQGRAPAEPPALPPAPPVPPPPLRRHIDPGLGLRGCRFAQRQQEFRLVPPYTSNRLAQRGGGSAQRLLACLPPCESRSCLQCPPACFGANLMGAHVHAPPHPASPAIWVLVGRPSLDSDPPLDVARPPWPLVLLRPPRAPRRPLDLK